MLTVIMTQTGVNIFYSIFILLPGEALRLKGRVRPSHGSDPESSEQLNNSR